MNVFRRVIPLFMAVTLLTGASFLAAAVDVPAPGSIPTLVLDSGVLTAPTVIDLGKGSVSLGAEKVTYYADRSGVLTRVEETGTAINRTYGYTLTGALTGDAALSVQNPPAAVTVGTAGFPASYQASGLFAANNNFTVYGNLTVDGEVVVTGGTLRVQDLNAKKVSAGLPQGTPAPAEGLGPIVAADNLTASEDVLVGDGGNLQVSNLLKTGGGMTLGGLPLTSTGGYAVSAKGIEAAGNVAIFSNVKADTVTAGGTLEIRSLLPASCVVNGTGDILVDTRNGSQANTLELSSLKSVSGKLTVNTPLTAGTVSAGGDILLNTSTKVIGSLEAGGALTAVGELQAGTVRAANDILLKGAATVSTLESVNGRVTADAALTATGEARAKGDLILNQDVQAGSLVSTGGSIDAASLRQIRTTQGGISAAVNVRLSGGAVVNGPVSAANGMLTLGGNLLDAQGAVSAASLGYSGTAGDMTIRATSLLFQSPVSLGKNVEVTGELSAPTVHITGNVKAGTVNVTGQMARDVQGEALAVSSGGSLTATGAITVNGGIRLDGPVTCNSSVTARSGEIVGTAAGVVERATALSADNGGITLAAKPKISGLIYGKTGVTLNGGSECASIVSDGRIELFGFHRVSGDIRGNTVRLGSGAQVQAKQVRSNAANGVILEQGAMLLADSVSGITATALTVETPFGAGREITLAVTPVTRTAYAPSYRTTDSRGAVLVYLPQGEYRIAVYNENGTTYSDTVRVAAGTGAQTLNLVPSSSSSGSGGGSGGGGGGGSSEFDNDAFWEEAAGRIADAAEGSTVRVSAGKADNVPVWILRELEGRDVTLHIVHGSTTIDIHGENMYDIPRNRIYYRFEDLAELYKVPPEGNDSDLDDDVVIEPPIPANPSSSSAPTAPSQPAAPVIPVTKPASSSSVPSSSEESSSQVSSKEEVSSSEPESKPESEPEAKPTQAKKKALFPVLIVVLVATLLAGGGVAFYLLRNKRRDDIYTDSDE